MVLPACSISDVSRFCRERSSFQQINSLYCYIGEDSSYFRYLPQFSHLTKTSLFQIVAASALCSSSCPEVSSSPARSLASSLGSSGSGLASSGSLACSAAHFLRHTGRWRMMLLRPKSLPQRKHVTGMVFYPYPIRMSCRRIEEFSVVTPLQCSQSM